MCLHTSRDMCQLLKEPALYANHKNY